MEAPAGAGPDEQGPGPRGPGAGGDPLPEVPGAPGTARPAPPVRTALPLLRDAYVRERDPVPLLRWAPGGVGLLATLLAWAFPLLLLRPVLFRDAPHLHDALLLLVGVAVLEHLATRTAAWQAEGRDRVPVWNLLDPASALAAAWALQRSMQAVPASADGSAPAALQDALVALSTLLLVDILVRLVLRLRLPLPRRAPPAALPSHAPLVRVFEQGASSPGTRAGPARPPPEPLPPEADERLRNLAVPGPCLALVLAVIALSASGTDGLLGPGLALAALAAGAARQAAEHRRTLRALEQPVPALPVHRLVAVAAVLGVALLAALARDDVTRLLLLVALGLAVVALVQTRASAV